MNRLARQIGWIFGIACLVSLGVSQGLAQEVRLDLIPPTQVGGYAQGLQVGGGNLTTLVVLITNYVLGFLGLIAITAIIYAGILYVANFGNDEMTGKAKNIITYVAAGILVIILSYAIVNALVGVVGRNSGNVPAESDVVTLDTLFDVEGKDFVFPIVTTLRDLGDLCPSTPIGLIPNNSGCAQNELVPDTDSDGVANVLDTDDDDDGLSDEQDPDDDGDGVCDIGRSDASCASGPDLCPDTVSFVTFKVLDLERNKIQVDRVLEDGYLQYIEDHNGCAEYQRIDDIDGDGVPDRDDCDRDADGVIDNSECASAFFNAYPPGNPEGITVSPETTFRGIRVLDVIRQETDTDDDNDGVLDFGTSLQPEARDLLLRQLANNFNELEQFIRITCATLPQTRRVIDYCGYDQQGVPFGKLVRRLDQLSSDLTFTDFETFNDLYQEFISVAKSFPRVQVRINANPGFEGSLPTDNAPFRVSFDAINSVDPYQEFCPAADTNYFWFVNKSLNFNQGLAGVLGSTTNPPDGTGVFFNYDFSAPGVYNVQLLVRSACKYNIVNPGAGENGDVDAAIAGLASARVNVFPARARLVVKVNDQPDTGALPVRVLASAQAPVQFDLRESVTSRGSFEYLNYDCGTGGSNTIQGNQSNWTFQCSFADPTGTKAVRLQARDGEGDVNRVVSLQFANVISTLRVEPGLQGTTNTSFTFDGTQSSASQQITNYTYTIEQKRGTAFVEIQRFQQQTVNFQFPAPGEYRVTLEVSTGGAADQVSSDTKTIVIGEQEPVAAFKISFPESIRPARALLDGSLSFHPDFPTNPGLSYVWQVDGVVLQPRGATSGGPYVFEPETAGNNSRVFYEFQSVGEHQVSLTVAKGDQSDTVVDTVQVKTLLGVDFTIDTPATRVNEVVTFTPDSDKALGFFWDFGDGVTLVSQDEPVVHKYARQGIYVVKLTVEDGAGNTNTLQKKVIVGLQNAPIPFVQVFVNNIEQDLSLIDCVEVSRNDNVVFDAARSVNIAGQTSGLSYLWEIEDFEEIVQTRSFTRIFKELTRGGCIDVDLTITDLSTNAQATAETISIRVVNRKPELTDVRFNTTEQVLVTPVTVNVSVVGARDLDGRVTRYRWWYYEAGQTQRKLDQRITDIARTTFVIGPNNVEGTETTYYIGVEVEDNDGGVVSNVESVGPSQPLVVTNGPNVAPVAEFITDRSTIQTGEIITFRSTTRDPLGEFIPSAAYQWDFDGNGEYERGITGAVVTHRYESPGLYRAVLKVTKNGLSSQYEMLIRVIASTREPEAAFIFVQNGAEVKFISNSQVDSALEDKQLTHAWDFDTTIDTDGNGITDDDADSALLSPTYEFDGNRDVFVSLKVTDSVGNADRVTRLIPFIKQDTDRGALGSSKVVRLKPVLITNPPRNEVDGKIYVRPPYSDVVFNPKQSEGKIQEYRIDSNIFIDSDGDGILDNDIDNKTHKSWKDGSSFKWTYRESDQPIRAKLTLVDLGGQQKSQVVEVVFSEKDPDFSLDQTTSPEEVLNLFENVPVVSFTVDTPFAQPDDQIAFDASRTKFPNEKVQEYRWDFDGDGLVDEISFEPTFTYAYPQAGVYEAILEAVSERGLLGEYSQTVFIRGGLTLPEASFEYALADNQLTLTNTSTVDASFNPEEVQYEWTFKRLDLDAVLEWKTWQQTDEYIVDDLQFNQPPLWVLESVVFDPTSISSGLLPREVVLGSDEFVARFKEGATFLSAGAQPYTGELSFSAETNAEVEIPDRELIQVYQTGVSEVLEVSDEVRLVFNGVISDPELFQLSEGLDPVSLGQGTVENNLTIFTLRSFGGRYALTGTIEPGSEQAGEVLGVSTVKDPVKVFETAGVYQVLLRVVDPLGEKSEMSELITIDENLQVVEPAPVVPMVPTEPSQPIPAPEVIPDDNGGFSYWWLFFIVFIILVLGGVGYVVVQTILKRQEELDAQKPGVPSVEPVVKAEVVSSTPAPTAVPEQKAPPAPEKPAEEKKDKDDQGKPPVGDGGPIPDWLKG
ncbi:MAG: PKD domain-containing protein [Candidatus Altimarinota bacterium]